MRLAAVLDAPRTAAAEPSPAEGFATIPGVPMVPGAPAWQCARVCAHACPTADLVQLGCVCTTDLFASSLPRSTDGQHLTRGN